MARKIIDIGTIGNDGTGDSIRDSFRKVNDNFGELYSSLGLGDKLKFIGLSDTPDDYSGQVDPNTNNTPIVTINDTGNGLAFKRLVNGTGINIDFTTAENEIVINSAFSEISADDTPQLGGDLSAKFGAAQYRIVDLPPVDFSDLNDSNKNPKTANEAISKAYADSKIARAGINALDPETGTTNSAFGRMTGPLILSRDPQPSDDENFDGLVAATKRYVDSSAFGSAVNLYVATSGADNREGVSAELQGRALAYAYRSFEAALKRAEELVNESRVEIGPYKKTLTYNQGNDICTLSSITTSPSSGSGFSAVARMSVDTININTVGVNYYPGDILTITGGTVAPGGEPCRLEVLSTSATPGAVVTFRIITAGVYATVPASSGVGITITTSAAPAEVGPIGAGVTFNVTYKVNNVSINPGGNGTGYSLVSVRITGGGGTGAFGTANVVGGSITGITIDDPGSGFTSTPTVVADLPRFAIYTAGQRTDFTGDVLTETPEAYRGRDIREGLYLYGEESGALAQILGHSGALDTNGNELFDMDIKYGTFKIGEPISYGDITKNIQISILVESGIYEEHLPLKVPQNVAIIGDEFRRVIIKPKFGTSSSPWAFQKFRRDLTIDGLTTATQEFGWHYLHDSSNPVHAKISNKGAYKAAANLVLLNRSFMQEEVMGWIASEYPSLDFNTGLCRRDVGLLIDAMIYDLRYGGFDRTVSAGLKYYESASGRIAITTQLPQTSAAINHLKDLMVDIVSNIAVDPSYQGVYSQIIDLSFVSESGSTDVINELFVVLQDVIDGSGSVNYPKENNQMDVFLCNDAVIVRAVTCQGHGGFMMVLDPSGQILAKSPYAQECASFSRSIDAKIFAGGQFVDGFAGNLEFKILSTGTIPSTRLEVGQLDRLPNLPCSFIVNDSVYRVNYIRDFVYDKDGSTATFILDETTPWPFELFTYDSDICSRDVGYIVDGLGYDIVFGTNFNSRKAGLTYRLQNAEVVIESQRDLTVRAIDYAHQVAKTTIDNADFDTNVDTSSTNITRVVERGTIYAPVLNFTNPPGLSTDLQNARTLLQANIDFIKEETIGWINAQIAGPTAPFTGSFSYNAANFSRDVGTIVEALIYDLIYGGNSQTRDAGLKYYDGVGSAVTLQIPGQVTETVAALTYVKDQLAKQVVQNLAPTVTYSGTPRVTGTPTNAGTVTIIETLLSNLITTVSTGTAPASETLPDVGAYSYSADKIAARQALVDDRSNIQSSVIDWVDYNSNLYQLLMPGNRSMLANDFTQVNDLGYGIVGTNGGLIEAVSMFTYYNHISYYSINGAQIRSIGGSSAHGNYALVAEGSDPLEVPTPTDVYYNFSQRLYCYAPSSTFENVQNGLTLFVDGYDYVPLNNSELEVDHGNGLIYRYPVTSVSTDGVPAGVARLNLTSDDTGNFDGLYDAIPDNTVLTLRNKSQIILTGGLEDVAVRPSTGLVLNDTPDVYRVLQFSAFTDPYGPYSLLTAVDSSDISVTLTIKTIASDLCTTTTNHRLNIDDKFISTTTSNGLTAGVTYYVIETPLYNQFKLSTTKGGTATSLLDDTDLNIKGIKAHKLLGEYTVKFNVEAVAAADIEIGHIYRIRTVGTTDFTLIGAASNSAGTLFTATGSGVGTGTATDQAAELPAELTESNIYYVTADGLTETTFKVSATKGGSPITLSTIGVGNVSVIQSGLTRTTLRENYNYVDATLYQPGEYAAATKICTISIADPAVITSTSHGLSTGDVIRFDTTGTLPTGILNTRHYHVLAAGLTAHEFRISDVPNGNPIGTSDTQAGTQTFGLVTGRVGDDQFAVNALNASDAARVVNKLFMFKGQEYRVTAYEGTSETSGPYGRLTINPPLLDSIVATSSSYTVQAAVPVRDLSAFGDLTIRIALTRVTGHDLLEIGTGSYSDTNYPNEIYGPPVNSFNEDNEVEERDVGRVFYVTTDQYGNFSVGPYFRVDQGTGSVTFAASIALSNLDGIGFKRGVPIAEFSVDSSFTDNGTDTVPTENATRVYIERRLGKTHSGDIVEQDALIPPFSGGYLSLDGQLAMKGDINLQHPTLSTFNKIVNLADPTDPRDAVNLQSLTIENIQNITLGNIDGGDLLVATGQDKNIINAKITGDISVSSLSTGPDSTLNQLNLQIVSESIENDDVSLTAGILQSKLLMNAASTRANATSITQADRGLASFDSSQFDVTDGWVTIKNNGITLSDLPQIGTKTVIGNSDLATATPTAVDFSTVIADGGGVKKSQYSTVGFLRRTNSSSNTSDGDYAIVEATSGASGYTSTDNSKLVIRNSSGDVGVNVADVQQLKVDSNLSIDSSTSASGGFLRYYGFNGVGGMLVRSGSLSTDAVTLYWNDAHQFKTKNGVSDAPITCSSIQTSAITAGGNTEPGTITGRWTLTGTSPNESRLQATYSADLAENYEGDKEYEVGTVLVFGGEKEVTTTNIKGDTRVAGVVSNTAAFAMYDACPGFKNLVALQGRVPCRVVGKIKKGDILVTSGIPGVATAAAGDVKVGTVVGKALYDYDSDHIGTLEIAVGRT